MWKCLNCNEDVADYGDLCPNCEAEKTGSNALDKEEVTTLREIKTGTALENSKSKYPSLRTIAGFLTLFAWIVGVVAIITAIYFFTQGEAGLIFAIPILVVGALIVLGVLAVSESIMVLIDIEYNTRQKSKTK